MLTIDKNGMLIHPNVTMKRFPHIEHGDLDAVLAIVVHQTDTSTAEAAFNSYGSAGIGVGAHFLIAKDGTIYQTASLHKRCFHVGRLIQSRCLEIHKESCADADLAKAKLLHWRAQFKAIDKIEREKEYPERFPVNSDSIGIELVGKHVDKKSYECATFVQNESLKWLITEFYSMFGVTKDDVFRHPQVGRKNPGEAASAAWQ
jgi:N-acetyl-anhydromuramyl-L-alanine amidase AmpD